MEELVDLKASWSPTAEYAIRLCATLCTALGVVIFAGVVFGKMDR
jgi:hypothetical protein